MVGRISPGRSFFRLLIVVMFLLIPVNAPGEGRPVELVLPDLSTLSPDEQKTIHKVFPSLKGDLWVQLENGLTVLVSEMAQSSVVSLAVHVKAGSIYEGDQLTAGLSHYLEHVVSGGSTYRRTEDEIRTIVKDLGGRSNAYTSYNSTVYFINTISSKAMEALDVLLDYVTNNRLDEKEVEREKGVIIREMLMGENDPSRKHWNLFMETAYLRHPARFPIIGYKDVFEKVTRQQLLDYYQRRYVPWNMIVSVAGNVRGEEILKSVIKQAGHLPSRPRPELNLPDEPPQTGPRRMEVESPLVRTARAEIGFPTISLTHPDLYALDVLAMILGSGRTSRLYKSLKDRHKDVFSVSASSWTPDFVRGLFIISLDFEYSKLQSALDHLWYEIERLKWEGPSEEELDRAKKKVQADHIYAQETSEEVAGDLASSYAATGDAYFNRYYTERIQEVTAREVQAAAKKYLLKNHVTVVVLKPAPETSPAVRTQPQRVREVGSIEKSVLSNGLTLLTRVNRSSPTISIQLYAPGGLRFEPAGKPGISLFMADLLTSGTQSRSKQDLAREVEDMGASLSSGSGNNAYYVLMELLSADFEKGMEIFSDVVTRPSFPQEEIEKHRTDTLAAIKRLDEDWTDEVVRLLNRTQFSRHPYRNDILGTPESVSKFTRDDLVNFYRSLALPNHMVLAVFGDIDPVKVRSMVEKGLGGLKPGDIPPARSFPEEFEIRADKAVRKENEKSAAALLMAFNGVSLKNPDRPVVDVIGALMTGIGYPSGWIYQALRGGTRDLVYVVHGFPRYAPDGGNFLIMAQSAPQDLHLVKSIVTEQIQRLLTQSVNNDDFERAKQACIINHEMNLETNSQQASSVALDQVLGLGYDYDSRYAEMIRKVTPEDLKRVASVLFNHSLVIETIPSGRQGDH
jgi:zinc protease